LIRRLIELSISRTPACDIDSPRSIAPRGTAQLSLSERRIKRRFPSSFSTTTFTDGTMLFAAGASGSS
jgi:hypothetical protein